MYQWPSFSVRWIGRLFFHLVEEPRFQFQNKNLIGWSSSKTYLMAQEDNKVNMKICFKWKQFLFWPIRTGKLKYLQRSSVCYGKFPFALQQVESKILAKWKALQDIGRRCKATLINKWWPRSLNLLQRPQNVMEHTFVPWGPAVPGCPVGPVGP